MTIETAQQSNDPTLPAVESAAKPAVAATEPDTKAVFDGFWICKGTRKDIVKAETEEGAKIFYREINGFEAVSVEPCNVQPRHRDVVVCNLVETDEAGNKRYHMSRSTYSGS